jgi:hypothetical protein
MLPNNLGAWVFVLVSCLIGFVIGQWLKARRNKVEKNNEYLNSLKRMALAETRGQTKKAGKKNRRANKKNGASQK